MTLAELLATGDPLLADGVDLEVFLIVVVKTVIAFAIPLLLTALMIWVERKVHGDMTNRIGPNRAGPWGILQTLADGAKLFLKEGFIPERADRLVYRLAPYSSSRSSPSAAASPTATTGRSSCSATGPTSSSSTPSRAS
jgi:NADH:ubiquinone oxidoreductase subunit H